VACGSVEELRNGSTSRLVVDAPQAPPGWAHGVPGVLREMPTPAHGEPGTWETSTVLELAPDADDQLVLRAALATGPVREFRRRRPSLAELFRHVVSERHDALHPAGPAGRPGEAA